MDRRLVWLLAPLLCGPAGCAGNRQRLSECEQRIQTLQAQSDQLRNEALTLRNRNRDLAQRAVEDASRLRDSEEAQERLEAAITAYQEERRKLSTAFRELQQQVLLQAQADPANPQASLTPEPGALPDPARFAAFARAQPGARFDPTLSTWSFSPDLLFQPASAELSPAARLRLDAFARLLDDSSDPAVPICIVARCAPPPEIQRTSASTATDDSESLARARAERLRDELARRLDLDPTSIPLEVEPPSMRSNDDGTGLSVQLGRKT